jgi:hypothetical protein
MMAACPSQWQHILKHPQNWHMHGMLQSRVIGPGLSYPACILACTLTYYCCTLHMYQHFPSTDRMHLLCMFRVCTPKDM